MEGRGNVETTLGSRFEGKKLGNKMKIINEIFSALNKFENPESNPMRFSRGIARDTAVCRNPNKRSN
jgi:hypothetical protein